MKKKLSMSTTEIVRRLQLAEKEGFIDVEALKCWHAFSTDASMKVFLKSLNKILETLPDKFPLTKEFLNKE